MATGPAKKRWPDEFPTPTGHVIMWWGMFAFGALLTWGAFGPLQIVGIINSQAIAAWVQAVGALIAVGVAIAAPIWHAARIQRQRVQHSLWLITALAARIADGFDQLVWVAELRETLGGSGVEWFDTGISPDLKSVLDSVPIHSLPDDRLVQPIIALREVLRVGTGLSLTLKGKGFRASSHDADDARKLCARAAEEYDRVAEVFHERCGPFARPGYSPLPPGPQNEAVL